MGALKTCVRPCPAARYSSMLPLDLSALWHTGKGCKEGRSVAEGYMQMCAFLAFGLGLEQPPLANTL